jgi:CopG antitoxin of type II toxin-antitoxin system
MRGYPQKLVDYSSGGVPGIGARAGDWTKAARVRFPNLKPSTTAISLRLPVMLLTQRSPQARCSVSSSDQDLACGNDRNAMIIERVTQGHASVTATRAIIVV